MAKHRGREFWSQVVAEYEAEGGRHEAFAAARRMKVSTFRRWLYRLRNEAVGAGPKLLPVQVAPVGSTGSIEVAVADVVLRVGAEVDPARVVQWVRALETRGC